jgi:SAM-dependent methyltransferase
MEENMFSRSGKPTEIDNQGLNDKLYAAIPSCRKVLELGCGHGWLGHKYKQFNPATIWVGVDLNPESVAIARGRLDETYCIALDTNSIDKVGSGYDCVVIGDLLEYLRSPERLLRSLAEITTENATVICCVPNMGHISVLERMLGGDFSCDGEGLLERTHARILSPSALFKMLLDCGWLPTMDDQYVVGPSNNALLGKLTEAAGTLGVPPAAAQRFLLTYKVIVRCRKRAVASLPRKTPRISVIVPVNNDRQFNLNVVASPGLREIDAEVIACRDARNAAEALQQGIARASGDWYLFCDQDVYFPAGSGYELAARLSKIPSSELPNAILGFAGLSIGSDGRIQKSGLVLDRVTLFDHPSSASAVSLDELAVVVSRETRWKIDEDLGWHLWATDLCLQALFDSCGPKFAELLRIPLFHNSLNDFTMSESFRRSTKRLAAKYPQLLGIPTLCGTISAVHPEIAEAV